MPKQPKPPAPAPPLAQPGAYVREQARVAAEGQPPPKFSDLYSLDEQPLGEGRYSRVYAATHRGTGARRAVKTAIRRGPNTKIVDIGMECPGRLARHEADILKGLDHPNVIRVYEVYEEADAVHLVLELCEGSDVLERILVTNGRLPEHEISLLFVQMLFAVSHLHSRGVVHRDLKPEHFLFTRREPELLPGPPKQAALKVIDFGLSHDADAAFVPLGGTPQFMPPEVIQGRAPNQDVADRVDMWALGVVLHAMLVGHYPSPHLTDKSQTQYFAKSAWSACSKQVLDLLGQMLRQASANRPTSAAALQHPWAQAAIAARGLPSDDLVAALPAAIKAYYSAPGLQKLALMATAHDLDDFDYYGLRVLFQMLLQSGDAKLTQKSLQAIADRAGPWSHVAAALAGGSAEHSRVCGSGAADVACDWTDLLAAAALAGGKASKDGLPKLNEDACWRAFDVLSLSSGEISGGSLRRLLAYQPTGPIEKPDEGGRAGEYAPPEALDRLVRELFPRSEIVPRAQFVPMLLGEFKPQRQGDGASLLSCFRCPRAKADDPAASQTAARI